MWLAAFAVVVGGASAVPAEDDRTIVLQPGQNIQAIVARSPEGTRFRFEPGIYYRQQTIYPRSRQEFIGQDGVILSGAMELTSWTRDGEFWKAQGLPRPCGQTALDAARGRSLAEEQGGGGAWLRAISRTPSGR